MDQLIYPDDNEPSDGERRMYKFIVTLIGGLLLFVSAGALILTL